MLQSIRLVFQLLLLLLLLSTASVADTLRGLPDFDYSNDGKNYFLRDNQPWIPSGTTQLAVLATNMSLRVEIKLVWENESMPLQSCALQFKCRTQDKAFQYLMLMSKHDSSTQWKISSPHCTSQQGFVVERLSNMTYNLAILNESNVPFERSFEQFMEFNIMVSYTRGNLTSGSLYVFSVSSLFNINSEKRIAFNGNAYRKYFLTDHAIEFLMNNHSSHGASKANKPLLNIAFLDKKLIDLLKTAPQFLRTFLAVTVILEARSNAGDSCSFCISTGDYFAHNKTEADNSGNHNLQYSLSLATGVLLIDRLYIKMTESWFNSTVSVTLRVSLNNGIWGSAQRTETVMEYVSTHSNKNQSTGAASTSIVCEKTSATLSDTVTLYIGMEHVVLAPPIVCSNAGKQLSSHSTHSRIPSLSVKLDCGANCDNQQHGSMRYSRTVNDTSVVLRGPISTKDAGIYSFVGEYRLANYSFKVEVASLPTFVGPAQDSSLGDQTPVALPAVEYANLHLEVRLTCCAPHLGHLESSIQPRLRIRDTSSEANMWEIISLQDFAINYLRVAPQQIKQSENKFSLAIRLPNVTPRWKIWQLTFICQSRVSGADMLRALGVTHYQTETRVSIYYHGDGIVDRGYDRGGVAVKAALAVVSVLGYALTLFQMF